MRLFIPGDAAAVALDADAVAEAIEASAVRRKIDIEIVRNGSRGLHWLEPLVEVSTDRGRVAYGPVAVSDVEGVLDAIVADKPHPLSVGDPEEIPFLKNQTRLTFARCGIVDPASLEDYRGHGGYQGLAAALRIGPAATVEAVTKSGLRGRGGAGFPTGIKWQTVAATAADQ